MAIPSRSRKLLITLLVTSFFNGIVWSALIPMWHIPDEQAHFAQAQDIAAIGYRPNPGMSTSSDIVESEKLLHTFREGGNNPFTYHPEYRIPYTNTSSGLYENQIRSFPFSYRTEFVINEATGYPPLYYWYIAGVNKAFWGADLISRVFLSRIATVFLTTLAVYTSYALAREIFRDRFFALIAATLVSFHPMWRFVGSGVTSDAFMNAIYPLGVWALIRFWSHPEKPAHFLSFLGIVISAVMTKVQSLSLVIAGLPVILFISQRKKSMGMVNTWGSRILLVVLTVLIAVALSRSFPRAPTVPIPEWVALPELPLLGSLLSHPSLGEYIAAEGLELYRQTFPWYWGVYRWLSLTLPLWTYRLIKVLLLVSIFGWMFGIRKKIFSHLVYTKSFIILLSSSAVYAAGLLIWNYFFWKSYGFPFGIQGRYFFPNLTDHMIFFLTGILLLVPYYKRLIAFLLVMGMAIFHWYSLWFVSASYYDSSNIQTFFLQASQYKPWFFKTPYLPAIIICAIATNIFFFQRLFHYIKRYDS